MRNRSNPCRITKITNKTIPQQIFHSRQLFFLPLHLTQYFPIITITPSISIISTFLPIAFPTSSLSPFLFKLCYILIAISLAASADALSFFLRISGVDPPVSAGIKFMPPWVVVGRVTKLSPLRSELALTEESLWE